MSEPSPVSALPLEIIGNIIDMLVDDDTNGLHKGICANMPIFSAFVQEAHIFLRPRNDHQHRHAIRTQERGVRLPS